MKMVVVKFINQPDALIGVWGSVEVKALRC